MAAALADRADVTLVSTNPAIRAAIERDGLVAHGLGRHPVRTSRVRIVAAPPPGAAFDLAILATQPPSVEAAAHDLVPALADDGAVLVVQNGLCEARVGAIVGPARVVGGVVAWGATVRGPGVVEQTARGGFTLGVLAGDATTHAGVRAFAELLGPSFPVRITTNLRGVRLSKLALNAAISSIGTIAGEPLGPLVGVRRYRQLALEVMSEAVAVAHADGVVLERVAGTLDLNWVALTARDRAHGGPRLLLKHALLRAVGLRYRRMRSSMLAAIERGRPPAVDFLNGELVTLGAAHGVATPVNTAIVAQVWAIARGEARSSRATLDALCDRVLPSAA